MPFQQQHCHYLHSFNSNTATIYIFIKDFHDAHNTETKIYEKEPQTLSEVIKLVKKFNAVQQVMATLTSPTVNMMSDDDWCFVCRKTDHIGDHWLDAQCYNLWGVWPLHPRLLKQNPFIRNTLPSKQVMFLAMLQPQPERNHSPLTTDTTTGDALTGHDHTTNPTATEALATTKDTHPDPHPPTAAVCTILWLTDTLGDMYTRTTTQA